MISWCVHVAHTASELLCALCSTVLIASRRLRTAHRRLRHRQHQLSVQSESASSATAVCSSSQRSTTSDAEITGFESRSFFSSPDSLVESLSEALMLTGNDAKEATHTFMATLQSQYLLNFSSLHRLSPINARAEFVNLMRRAMSSAWDDRLAVHVLDFSEQARLATMPSHSQAHSSSGAKLHESPSPAESCSLSDRNELLNTSQIVSLSLPQHFLDSFIVHHTASINEIFIDKFSAAPHRLLNAMIEFAMIEPALSDANTRKCSLLRSLRHESTEMRSVMLTALSQIHEAQLNHLFESPEWKAAQPESLLDDVSWLSTSMTKQRNTVSICKNSRHVLAQLQRYLSPRQLLTRTRLLFDLSMICLSARLDVMEERVEQLSMSSSSTPPSPLSLSDATSAYDSDFEIESPYPLPKLHVRAPDSDLNSLTKQDDASLVCAMQHSLRHHPLCREESSFLYIKPRHQSPASMRLAPMHQFLNSFSPSIRQPELEFSELELRHRTRLLLEAVLDLVAHAAHIVEKEELLAMPASVFSNVLGICTFHSSSPSIATSLKLMRHDHRSLVYHVSNVVANVRHVMLLCAKTVLHV